MPDRDEVIKDGECAIAMLGEVEEPTPWCDFIRVSFENALALLREQEPVQFKVTQQRRSYPFWDAECDGCGYKTSTIHRNWKYCPECGRRIAWPD